MRATNSTEARVKERKKEGRKEGRKEGERERELVIVSLQGEYLRRKISSIQPPLESRIPLPPPAVLQQAEQLHLSLTSLFLSLSLSSRHCQHPPFLGFRFHFTSLPLARRQPAGLSFCAPLRRRCRCRCRLFLTRSHSFGFFSSPPYSVPHPERATAVTLTT